MTSQMDVKKEVSNLIRSLGISCNLIGYEYCRAAILLCYNDKKFLRSMSDLYKFLGEKYSCTPNSIERAIYNAIKKAKKIQNSNFISMWPSKRPSVHEFLATIVDDLKLAHNEI